MEGNIFGTPGVVTLVSNTKLRHVTVSNTGGVTQPFAITVAGGPISISDVTATATDGVGLTLGVLGDDCGELILTNVTAIGEGPGSAPEGVRASYNFAI